MKEPSSLVTDMSETLQERLDKAAKKGHIKTPRFKFRLLQDEEWRSRLQTYCLESVMGYVNQYKKPAHYRRNIIPRVKNKVRTAIQAGRWKDEWGFPGNSAIERRINEIAEKSPANLIMKNDLPKLVGVGNGRYFLNPAVYPHVKEFYFKAIKKELRILQVITKK